jgi:hypothetical protein
MIMTFSFCMFVRLSSVKLEVDQSGHYATASVSAAQWLRGIEPRRELMRALVRL